MAGDADLTSLVDARRRYAISTVIEPLGQVSGRVINPQALMAAVTSTSRKRRMARGKVGDLGDHARIGQEFLMTWPRRTPPSAAWVKAWSDG